MERIAVYYDILGAGGHHVIMQIHAAIIFLVILASMHPAKQSPMPSDTGATSQTVSAAPASSEKENVNMTVEQHIYEQEILQFEEADRSGLPPKHGILFVGSSTIALWNATVAEDFAPLPAYGRGFGSSAIEDSLYFAHRIIVPYQPRVIVFYAGENDIAFRGKSPADVCADFQALVELIHAELPATRLIYLAQKPSPSRMECWDKLSAANTMIREVCLADPLLAFIDTAPLMLDAQGQPREELYSDGLHMTRAGYELWIPHVRAAIEEALAGH